MGDQLTIGFAGDVMLGRTLDSIISLRGYDYPWGNVQPVLKGTDINIINLETTLTNSNKRVDKTFNFKAKPDKIQSLINANVTVANLANNHILDYGNEGLLETLKTLDVAGIKHVGAGKNLNEASAPVIIKKNNTSIGVLGITDNEPGWKAGTGPGTHYINIDNPEEYPEIFREIENLKKQVDLAVVSVHWGPNMREEPPRQFIEFAHLMSEHGADVIHGHSAHILQRVERFNKTLILFDTGDFVDDYAVDPDLRNDLSAFFILTADKSGLPNLRLIPTRIFQYQVNMARRADLTWVVHRMEHLSSPFGTHIDKEGAIHTGPGKPGYSTL